MVCACTLERMTAGKLNDESEKMCSYKVATLLRQGMCGGQQMQPMGAFNYRGVMKRCGRICGADYSTSLPVVSQKIPALWTVPARC